MEKQPSSFFTQTFTAPSKLINLNEARRRFGTQRVELLIELMYKGDALADAVIEELETLGAEASRQLNLGINQGLKSVDQPLPAIRAFLAEIEDIPHWVDRERLVRGSEAFLSIGSIWLTLALGPGSLTHTYSSSSIASVLIKTGNLTTMAQRRLVETGTWNIASILPGGLLPGADGAIHNVQVRLLHARIRKTLLKHGWDRQAMGIPLNQVEMMRTWLDFTYVPFEALQKFGITFTDQELSDLYHFWQYIAYLLGIDRRFYGDVTDQQSARNVLALIDSTTEGASEDSKILVQAMLEAITGILQPGLKLPSSIIYDLISAITRHLHGNELADQLGIKKTWLRSLMPFITLVNRFQRGWDRRSPAARRKAVSRTVHAFQQLPPLEGLTTYQRNASNSTQQDLPKTVVTSSD